MKAMHKSLENWSKIFNTKIVQSKKLDDSIIKEILEITFTKQELPSLDTLKISKEDKNPNTMINILKQDREFMTQLTALSNNDLGEFELLAKFFGITNFEDGMDSISLYGYDIKSFDTMSILGDYE
jgi:predicted lactoylglutathione lyase